MTSEVFAVTLRALLKVTAPSAVLLALLASGTLVYSPISSTPAMASVSESKNADTALRAFARAWRARDYDAARAAGRRVIDPTLSSRLDQLLVFAEARQAIEKNDTVQSCRLAGQLEPGAKRALVFAAMSSQLRGREESRSKWIQIALSDAARLPQREKRALLSVLLPVVLNVDARRGLRLLDEAIHDHTRQSMLAPTNELPPPKYATGVIGHGSLLLETVRGPGSKEVFILRAPGLQGSDLRDLALSQHARLRCRQLRHRRVVIGGKAQGRELRFLGGNNTLGEGT